MIDSGWNWTAATGRWACSTPITTPSSVRAVTIQVVRQRLGARVKGVIPADRHLTRQAVEDGPGMGHVDARRLAVDRLAELGQLGPEILGDRL